MCFLNIVKSQSFKNKINLSLTPKINQKIKLLIADDDMFCIMAFKTICKDMIDYIIIYEAYNGLEVLE